MKTISDYKIGNKVKLASGEVEIKKISAYGILVQDTKKKRIEIKGHEVWVKTKPYLVSAGSEVESE